MKIGIQTGELITRLGIESGYDAIAAAGFDCVDLNLDDQVKLEWNELREGVVSPFFADPAVYRGFIAENMAAAKRTGVAVGQMHSPFPNWFRGLDKANENFMNWTKISIELCHECDCHLLVVHPLFEASMRRTPSSRAEEWDVNIAFYQALIPTLKKYDVVCCLENMWGQDYQTKKIYNTVCSDMNEVCRYIDTLNELAGEKRFGFCLDIGHLTLLGNDPYEAIMALGDRLCALHVHDNGGGTIDDHMMPYTGVTIWERFLRGIAENGYTGTLSFETSGQNRKVPNDFLPQTVHMIADIGRYFSTRIEAMRNQ